MDYLEKDLVVLTIIAIILLSMIALIEINSVSFNRGYKQGQIDCTTGTITYCLDSRFEWIEGQPIDGLRCKGE